MTKAKRGPTVYTDTMILAMCDAAHYWAPQLRSAAYQRKLGTTSVTPIADVIAKLRAAVA